MNFSTARTSGNACKLGCSFAERCLCCILADAKAAEMQGMRETDTEKKQIHMLNGVPQGTRTENS